MRLKRRVQRLERILAPALGLSDLVIEVARRRVLLAGGTPSARPLSPDQLRQLEASEIGRLIADAGSRRRREPAPERSTHG